MTGIPQLSNAARSEIRRRLRARAGEFLQRFYRHDILVGRAVRGVQIEAAQRFRSEVADPLVREIAGRLATFDPRGHAVTPANYPELANLIQESEAIIARGVESVRLLTEQRMADIAEAEADFVAENVDKTLDEPFGTGVRRPVSAEVGKQFLGEETEQWFKRILEESTGTQLRQRIMRGLQEGQTVDQIVRGIRGTKTETGILDNREEEVRALVVTATSNASADTRFESYEELGVEQWRWLDTLDSRTCIICAANAKGGPYNVGEGPVFPAHPRCRCTPVPYFGEPTGTRASSEGQVPADMDLETYLKTRPQKEQDHTFGVTKAKAWRAGKLSLKQMLGSDMQPLTLEQLRKLDRL